MSQFFISSTAAPPPPQVATSFVTDIGGPAVPVANVLNVPGGTSTSNNINGIQTLGSGNTLTIQLTNRIIGSGTTTDGVTPVTLFSFPMGAVPGTYSFTIHLAVFDVTDSIGAGYSVIDVVRTTGAAGVLIGGNIASSEEEGALTNLSFSSIISGNNFVVEVIGLAGKTINYVSITDYVFAS